jgi:hypothetical protein
VLDGVHLWAKVARRSWVQLLRKGRGRGGGGGPGGPGEGRGPPDRVRAPSGGARTPGRGGPAARRGAGESAPGGGGRSRDAGIQARVAQVRTLLAGEGDRVVSFDDPDARWGYKAADKPFWGYKAHEALDPPAAASSRPWTWFPATPTRRCGPPPCWRRTPCPALRGPWSPATPITTPPRSPRWKKRGRGAASRGGPRAR